MIFFLTNKQNIQNPNLKKIGGSELFDKESKSAKTKKKIFFWGGGGGGGRGGVMREGAVGG